ncbi:hypothetical protein F444_05982 [Phytophthora nicotianae P1976]|uniref:Uncharacterized protein n=1 Tax=Phytophthora nicotianae P1976 TaxID=1317066 RepID=A0A081AK87_PHYNI|nr:hypothetical protein F444_05982 [Phytophthora nicotianae P1976]
MKARIKSSVKNLFKSGDLDSASISACVEDFVASKRTSKQKIIIVSQNRTVAEPVRVYYFLRLIMVTTGS